MDKPLPRQMNSRAPNWLFADMSPLPRSSRAGAQSPRAVGHEVGPLRGELHELWRDDGEEAVAQVPHDLLREAARVGAALDRARDGGEGAAGVVVGQRVDELVDLRDGLDGAAARDGDLERGERVADGAAALLDHAVDRRVGHLEPRVRDDPADEIGRAHV